MSRFAILCGLVVAMCSPAEIIDRVAAKVGKQVVTVGEIIRQIRVAAFLNGEEPGMSAEQKRKAADRLVELALIRREMELIHYPPPAEESIDLALEAVKTRYSTEAEYRQALAKSRLNESELTQQLVLQLTIVSFIDYRFRPEVQISDADIKDYYDKHAPEWATDSKPAPTFEETRGGIEKILSEERSNQALDRWLGEMRAHTTIVFRDEVLR